jgi:lipopolysaccharide export LptBFGC system permease protein LptF
MAQTKRKRQTKHRGNAAGVVESRGRTGRKPTSAEKSGKASGDAARKKEQLLDKRDRPPTWRAAFVKAMFASVLMLLAVIIVFNRSNQGIGLFPIVLVAYTLISYYTDKWVYDRRQRKKLRQGGGGRATSR